MKMIKTIALILGIIIIVSLLSIFYYFSNHSNTMISKNRTGNIRIVVLAPSDTQILISLGLGKYIVGMDYYSYQLLKYLNITNLIPNNVTVFNEIAPPNISGILLLRPTVVIVEKGLIGSYLQQLEEAGLNVFVTNNDYAVSFPQIENTILQIGKYFNLTQNAEELINWMNERISEFSSVGNVSIAYLLWVCPNLNFYTVGGNVFVNSIITLAGGVNVFSNYSGYPLLTPSNLILSKPSIIIVQEEYNLTYTNYLISQYHYINESKIYILGNFATSLFNEPGPLSVYSIRMINMIIKGETPKYISYSWLMANLNVTLPVF